MRSPRLKFDWFQKSLNTNPVVVESESKTETFWRPPLCPVEPLTLEEDMAQLVAEDYGLMLPYGIHELYPNDYSQYQARLDTTKSHLTRRHEIGIRRRDRYTCQLKSEKEIAYMVGHEMTHALQVERDGRGCWQTFFRLYLEENARAGYVMNRFEIEARTKGKDMAAKLCGLHKLELVTVHDSEVYVPS